MESEYDEVLIFFDLESGGFFDVVAGKVEVTRPVIQIAAIAVDRHYRERDTFEMKVQFDEADADPAALAKNHYDRRTWQREALPARGAAERFAKFLRRHATVDRVSKSGRLYRVAQLVAHNAERFDGPLIHAWFAMLDQFCPASYSVFCTKQRAYWLFHECKQLTPPADYRLGTLCEYFDIPLRDQDAHDALNDARATVQLYQAILRSQRKWSTNLSRNVPPASAA